jgi:hypothetical protein
LAAVVLHLLSYELLFHNFRFIDFKSTMFSGVSLHWVFAANVLLPLVGGLAFIVLVSQLHRFRFANAGGTSFS